jgi:hypothetical protein
MSSERFFSFLRFFVFSGSRFRGCTSKDVWLIQGMDVLAGSSYKAEIMGMGMSLYSH